MENTDIVDDASIDLTPMGERRWFHIKIVMLMRVDMRELFGMEVANRWGFWVDRYLSKQVRDFADWIQYPKGDHVLDEQEFQVRSAAMTRDSRYLFTGSGDGTIKLWNMEEHHIVAESKGHERAVLTLATQCWLLVSGCIDGWIRVWHTLRGFHLIHTLDGHTKSVTMVDINDKATDIVSCSIDTSIRIWSVKSGECIKVLNGHSEMITSVMFIGKVILSGSWDRSIKEWNMVDDSETRSITEGIRYDICQLSVNCDRSLLACIFGIATSLYTWPEMRSIPVRISLSGVCCQFHSMHPNILAVSHLRDHSIKMYTMGDCTCVCTLKGHSDYVRGLCFTEDGSRLVSVSDDKSVRVWDISEFV